MLSRDTLLSPTKGEGPLVVASRPTITRNVKIQFEADASDAAGVRIASGAYSAGTDGVSKKILFW